MQLNIRESVGATHIDMAEILFKRGMKSAMGFDPGGSATLVVGKETLNISPYSRDYERNVYFHPPQNPAVLRTQWWDIDAMRSRALDQRSGGTICHLHCI